MLKDKFYTVAEVAEITGLNQRTIRNYIKDGSLHGKKIGAQWRFTEEDIKCLFKETDLERKLFSLENNLSTAFILNTEKIDIETCMILDIPDLDLKQIRELNRQMKLILMDKSMKVKLEYSSIKEEGFYRIICSGAVDDVTKLINDIKGSIGGNVFG